MVSFSWPWVMNFSGKWTQFMGHEIRFQFSWHFHCIFMVFSGHWLPCHEKPMKIANSWHFHVTCYHAMKNPWKLNYTLKITFHRFFWGCSPWNYDTIALTWYSQALMFIFHGRFLDVITIHTDITIWKPAIHWFKPI